MPVVVSSSSMATELLEVSRAPRGTVVLDEDEWTEVLEHIIERDYFPDIPKMQNKLEWLQVGSIACRTISVILVSTVSVSVSLCTYVYASPELLMLQAVRSRDPELLRQAQLNIAQRRAGIKTPLGASPATFATPGGLSSFRAPASLLRTPGAAQTPRPGAELAPAGRHVLLPWPDHAARQLPIMALLRQPLRLHGAGLATPHAMCLYCALMCRAWILARAEGPHDSRAPPGIIHFSTQTVVSLY